MTRQRRSALHGKRGSHPGRAGPVVPVLPPIVEPTTPTTPTTPAAAKDNNTPATTSTTSTTTGLIPGIISSILSPVSGESSTSISSQSSSTTSVSAKTSSVTTSSSPTHSVPAITSAAPPVVVQTATRVSSSTSIQSSTPSETAQVSNGVSAVTVISGIGGALLATILLTILIGFILRRWRKNRSAEDTFDASQFRRSGVAIDEKDDNTHDFPRPPSMIERRNEASPPAAYPFSDEQPPLAANEHAQSFAQFGGMPKHPSFATGNQFGANGGAPAMHYGATPQAMDYRQGAAYSGPGEEPVYGAPPVPGIHGPGTYAPYGFDPRYPQSQRYPRPQQYQNQQPQHQQLGFGQGPTIDTPTTRDENVSNLVNPFSPLRVSKKLRSSSGPEESLPTTPTISPSSTPPPSLNPGAAATPFVTRQSREALPNYTNNGEYADVQRDVKMSPALLNVVNGSVDTAVPPTDAAAAPTTTTESNGRLSQPPRPDTVYGDDDVYGGM